MGRLSNFRDKIYEIREKENQPTRIQMAKVIPEKLSKKRDSKVKRHQLMFSKALPKVMRAFYHLHKTTPTQCLNYPRGAEAKKILC